MLQAKGAPSGGKFFWLFQRLSGFVLLFILLLHFFLIHFTGNSDHVTFESVKERLVSPYWKTLDISFLFLAMFHGLYGFWMISDDYFRRPWMRTVIFSALCIAGLFLVIFGGITIIRFPAS